MAHLTLAGLSEDGKRLLLVGDNGDEHTLDVDAALRAALRGEHARLGQLEITMDSTLRPRDIQARIRGGESAESVALAAQSTVERIMPFAAPVLAERAHVAQRAQLSSVRRRSGETGARTLGEAVTAHLRSLDLDPAGVDWDAWRREDGRWTLVGVFTAPQRTGTATFAFDVRGNFVTVEDDHARWLVGDQVTRATGADRDEAPAPADDDQPRPRQRRLSSVPADELPLGEDAIEMVHTEAPGDADTDRDDAERDEPSATETTMDLTRPVTDDEAEDGEAPAAAPETAAPQEPAASEPAASEPADEEERPARRPARKGRGRASVPSWDEIMFGGGKSD